MKPFALKPKNRQDEAEGQKHVVRMLRAYLPEEVFWTVSLSGIRLPMHTAVEAKRMGMERGAPDLSFLFPDGVTRYIEMKRQGGKLSAEQEKVAALAGPDRFAVVEADPLNIHMTWKAVQAVLTAWMQPLGLRWLTERESLQREAKRRAA